MAHSLAELGYGVDLLIFPLGQDVSIPGVTLHRSWNLLGIQAVPIGPSWRKIFLDLFLFFKAFRLVLSNRYAAIQGVEEAGFIAWFLGKLFRTPSIFDMDSCMVNQLESSGFMRSGILLRAVSAVERFCIRRSTAVITVCASLTEKVRSFAPEAAIYQIEDFPLEGIENVSQKLIENLCNEFKLTGKRIALYTGNFEVYQGIDLLIEAFALVRKRSAKAVLLMVGGDSGKIELYSKKTAALGIEDSVIFTGPRPSEEMGTFMSLADVLVSPRLHGGNTPLKLYSYMAMCKPIVATDILSHSQVLDGTSAFLAPPQSGPFADALLMALDDTGQSAVRSAQVAARARELVETKYSRACFVSKLKSLYTELVGPPVAGASS
jgi:glycosyltransferase involved in cell wall biosynthesis